MTNLVTVIERSDNEVEVDGKSYWCPAGGGYVRLVTEDRPGTLGQQVCDGLQMRGSTISCRGEKLLDVILRELEAPRLLVVEADSTVGPRVLWWGDVDAEEIEAQLDEGQAVDWSSTVDTFSGGHSAPLVAARPAGGSLTIDRMMTIVP